MKLKHMYAGVLSALAFAAFSGGAAAQDIKIGYNGDLSASPLGPEWPGGRARHGGGDGRHQRRRGRVGQEAGAGHP
jgi:hypothetical protein